MNDRIEGGCWRLAGQAKQVKAHPQEQPGAQQRSGQSAPQEEGLRQTRPGGSQGQEGGQGGVRSTVGTLEGLGGGAGGVLGYPEAFSAGAQGFHSVCYAESPKGLTQGGDTQNGD